MVRIVLDVDEFLVLLQVGPTMIYSCIDLQTITTTVVGSVLFVNIALSKWINIVDDF